jgi:uncharacterized damage-inducible protein DinB
MPSRKQEFLDAYEREHAITARLLRAYPPDKLELQPHPKCKTARNLAWNFVVERTLGKHAFHNDLAAAMSGGSQPPAQWSDLLAALESAHKEFGDMVRETPEDELEQHVKFFTAPKTMGDVKRIDLLWFLLFDQIHHRGQFSIYSRMADGKVPSIYGPSADEPWS